jgi:nitrite reductase (NADH) large subunit
MNRRERLVVIGNGMAGARMVEELLARGGQDRYDIVMFGDEPYGNYNRILLSNVLNGSQDTSEIFLNPLDWYSQNNVRLHAGERVIGVDRERQRVFGASGISEPYDRLVFATGSRPFVPRMEGLKTADDQNKPGIFVFRTIEDCERIADYAQDSKRAAVIGGGLLGLEAAKGLMTHGVEVHVVHLAQALMENQVDEAGAKILAKTMGDLGVNLHLGKSTQRVLGDERVEGLEFSDGTTLEVDMVVISCGIMANVDLARDCGLDVERAILVDDQMRTPHDARVYAVGECAQHRGKVYGLVAPLWEQGKVLADHLVGRTDVAYGGSKIATKLKVMGVDLASMGITKPETDDDEVMVCSEAKRGIYRKLIIRDDRLIGAILLGDTSKAASLIQAFDSGSPLPDNRAEALFDIGETKGPASPVDLPDTAQICNCNGVSKGAIYACVKSGRKSLKMVMDATRAGMGCGSCKSSVATLVEHACGGSMIEDPSIHYYVPGVPLRKPELIEAIMEQELRSVSAVFMQLADGVEDPGSKMGLSSLLRTIWGKEYEDERDARFINDRVHANIQKDRTFSVIPRIAGGVTSAAELRKIADVADKYDVPMVKITGGQRIDLLGIKKEDLPGVWQDLGMPSGHGYAKSFRTCKTCVGTDFCRFGLGDSTGLGIAIETRFAGLESPGKLKLATAGCPRNCSEAYIKDVGVVAIEGGLWEIYVGGAGGAHVRKGDLLCTVNSHEEVLLITGRFIQYYRENAKYLERTYGFVERVGIAKIRAVVIEDEEGIAGRLDAAIQESVDSYVDPWLEAGAPATKNQFLTALPMVKA